MKRKTIGEIKAELKAAEESMLPVFIENYKEDTRSEELIEKGYLAYYPG